MRIKTNGILLTITVLLFGLIAFPTVDALDVSLTSPSDEAFTDELRPSFTFEIANLTDNVTCTLLVNSSDYGNENVTDNGTYLITANDDLTEGTSLWNIICNGDTAPQDFEINVDTTSPTISLESPEDNEIFSSETRRPDFTFNVNDNLDDSLDCELYIDDSTRSEWSATVDTGNSEIITPSQNVDWGRHTWKIKCSDNVGNTRTSSVRDFYMGGIEISDIDLDEDEVKPGEEITIDVEVENIMDDIDIDDCEIKAESEDNDLFEDDPDDQEIDEIKDGDKESVTFDNIRIDPEVDEGDYTINIEAICEDEDGEDHEAYDNIEIQVERERHELIIDNVAFDPSSVACGESTELTLDIKNIGRSDEDDTYFVVKNDDLDIEEMSEEFDVDKDDDEKEVLIIDISEDVEDKEYLFNVEVYYDDGDEKAVYIAKLDVDCRQPVYDGELDVDKTGLELKEKEEGEIKITVENTGDQETEYQVLLTGVSSWAEYSITPSEVELDPSETENLIVHIAPEEGVETGVKTATLILKYDDETLDSKSIAIDIQEKEEIDVEIISEGETGEKQSDKITGSAIFEVLEENTMPLIGGVIVVVVILSLSLAARKRAE